MYRKVLLIWLILTVSLFKPLVSSTSVNGFVVTNYEYEVDGYKTGSFTIPFVWLILQDQLTERFAFHVWYDFQFNNFIMGWLDIKLADYLCVNMGKMVAPSNQEWYTYPPDQMTPFFSEISGFVDVIGKGFDYGVGFSGSYQFLTYNMVIFNGGANAGEDNDKKNFCGRLTISPIKDLDLSVHTYQIYATAEEDERSLSGIDLLYTGFNFDIRAEYDFGKGGSLTTLGPNEITPGDYNGYYFMLGYKIPVTEMLSIQPVFKYNVFDPDVPTYEKVSDIVFGANFYCGKYFKLMLGYRKITDDSNTLYTDNEKKDLFILRAQLSF